VRFSPKTTIWIYAKFFFSGLRKHLFITTSNEKQCTQSLSSKYRRSQNFRTS